LAKASPTQLVSSHTSASPNLFLAMAMFACLISIGLCLSSAISQSLGPEEPTAVCDENSGAPSSALLQRKSRVSQKSVVTEVELSKKADPQYDLMGDAVSGASAPLTEAGYASVASMCCPMEARVYAQRLVSHLGLDVCDHGELNGVMGWFFCEKQNRTLEELTNEIYYASGGTCAWLAAAGQCRIPYEKHESCPNQENVFDPSNIIGTRGTCCFPSASTALVFAGATVISNNLGGKGPNFGDPQELRYTGVGTKNGQLLDLVVTVDKPSTYTPPSHGANNGLSGMFGVVVVWAGTSADLTFKIQDSATKAPVVLDEFYFSILDIDSEQIRIRERVYATYGPHLVDRVLEPSDRAMTEVGLDDGRTVYESTVTSGAWNNPTDPMVLGVATNPSNFGTHSVNQRKQALMFIYRKTSTWQLTFEATLRDGVPHGRNFIFGGTSAIIDICPQKQDPT